MFWNKNTNADKYLTYMEIVLHTLDAVLVSFVITFV